MRRLRTYYALYLLVLFCCYYTGISMFSHTHIAHGSSIVHSHLGGDKEHNHSDSQYAVIDLLSNFISECADAFFCSLSPFSFSSDSGSYYQSPVLQNDAGICRLLRAPPYFIL